MISKVVLEIEELFRMEIRFSPNNAKGGGGLQLPRFAAQLSFQLETCLLGFLP